MRRLSALALILICSACDAAGDSAVVVAMLPSAPGLKEGATVTYRGIEVGKVERIRFADTAVQVEFRLTRSDVPLRTRDQVHIASLGLLGDKAMDILPGPVTAPLLQPSDTLAAAPADSLNAVRAAVGDEIVSSFLRSMQGARNTFDSANRRFDLGADSSTP